MKIEVEIRQPSFRSPQQKLLINFLFTYYWLQNRQKDFFKPFGITSQQFNILRILRGQHPGSIAAAEIKKRMVDKNSDISRLLDRLTAKHLIYKSKCLSDKRAADVHINEKGLLLLKEIDPLIDKMEKALWAISQEEVRKLSDLLDKCRGPRA